MDYALVHTDSPAESRDYAGKYRDIGSVAMTEDVSVYLPSESEQARRIPHILEVRNKMAAANIRNYVSRAELPQIIGQIQRLEMNVMELKLRISQIRNFPQRRVWIHY